MPEPQVLVTAFKGSKSGQIVKTTAAAKRLAGDQVLVEIHHAGFCGTDLHYVNVDMVLGHEGAGVVKATGPLVSALKPGDRVGFGYIHDSCGDCTQCRRGDDAHCETMFNRFGRTELDQGGFATHAIWKERFLFKLPDGLSTQDAAPLMCAGITVFNPLVRYNIRPTDRVGVIGIGGLGHLAIQFAAKWGCDVIAFSSTDSKREEALRLGAAEFVATKGKKKLAVSRKVDHLFVTTSAFPAWKPYLSIMAPFGTIYPMSVDSADLRVPFGRILTNDLAIRGTTQGARQTYFDMFNFAVQHGIKPMLQLFPLTETGVSDARQALESGNLRYKAVFDVKGSRPSL